MEESPNIIPSLPDELGQECLLRAPYEDLMTAKAVSTAWRNAINSANFFEERTKRKLSSQILCLIQARLQSSNDQKNQCAPCFRITSYDTAEKRWKELSGYEEKLPMFSQFVGMKHKLILIGGWNPHTWDAMPCVFVYDFTVRRWSRAQDMPTVRSFFACAACPDRGLVYVAGGHDENKDALKAAEVFDVNTGTWTRLPDMGTDRDECEGVFVNGKFMVVSGYGTELQGRFCDSAEAYDPETGTWVTFEGMWGGGCPRSCFVRSEKHGLITSSSSKEELLRYDDAEKVWRHVTSLPEKMKPTCIAMCGAKVFVSGKSAVQDNPRFFLYDLEENTWTDVHRPDEFSGFAMSCTAVDV